MSTVINDRRYTPDDLLRLPDGDRFELIDGRLVEKDMSAKACRVAARVCAALVPFVESHRLGSVFESSATYRCFSDDPDRVRKPDVSFVSAARWRSEYEEGHIPIPPDLVVEVVSPNDLFYEVQEKIERFLAAGVRVVWLINPETELVQVYHSDRIAHQFGSQDALEGEDVLPGFRYAIAELFRPPPTA